MVAGDFDRVRVARLCVEAGLNQAIGIVVVEFCQFLGGRAIAGKVTVGVVAVDVLPVRADIVLFGFGCQLVA
ncbi:MAG: hypothetical protein WDZ30_05195 [Cellvibrionaceae bacterium]